MRKISSSHYLKEWYVLMKNDWRVIILLMRELLFDNRERAEQAQKWFLRPFLDDVVAINEWQQHGYYKGQSPLAFVYHLLGATQYYVVSRPTLDKLYARRTKAT